MSANGFSKDNSIEYKARLAIKRFLQKKDIDCFDTYAPVRRIISIRVLITLAIIHNLCSSVVCQNCFPKWRSGWENLLKSTR